MAKWWDKIRGRTSTNAQSTETPERGLMAKMQIDIRHAQAKLKRFRENRWKLLENYGGPWYTDKGKERPFNMLAETVGIMVSFLAARNPKAEAITTNPELIYWAENIELALDRIFREIDYFFTQRLILTDAFFGPAIARVGVGPGGVMVQDGEGVIDNGRTYLEHISLDDYFVDANARRRQEAWFEGNDYDVPLDFAHEFFEGADILERTKPTQGTARVLSGRGGQSEMVKMGEVRDVWLPPNNPIGGSQAMIVTLPIDGTAKKFLRTMEYDGPERGPYEMLFFNLMPDNVMPLVPSYTWEPLDELINSVGRKLKINIEAQKDLVLFDRGDEIDAEIVRSAPSGGVVGVANPRNFQQVSFGGANPELWATLSDLIVQYSRQSGNTEQMGGLRSYEKTATAASMIQGNAMVQIEDMATCLHEFTRHNVEKLAWYLMNDSQARMPLERSVPGTSYTYPEQYTHEAQQGEFSEYDFDIAVGSMQLKGPQQRVQDLLAWLSQVIYPTAEIGMMQGTALNVAKTWKRFGEELGIPNVSDLIVGAAPMPQEGGGAMHRAPRARGGTGGRTSFAPQKWNVGKSQATPVKAAKPAGVKK